MIFINPIQVTDATLHSSTRAENDYAAWSSVTTYALGDRCISTTTHMIYQSVQAGNTNHNPTTDTLLAWWVPVGPTNKWAMFDSSIGTITSQASPLEVQLDVGGFDSIQLLDVEGSTVRIRIEATPGGTVVYDETFSMYILSQPIVSWYTFFTVSAVTRSSLFVGGLPRYLNGRLIVTISGTGTVACGSLIVGSAVRIGTTQQNAKTSIIDYSVKTTDSYGVTTVVKRGFSKRIEVDVRVPAGTVDYVTRQLANVRAVPVMWIADETGAYESLSALGWLRDWGVVIDYPTYSLCNMQIEGLST